VALEFTVPTSPAPRTRVPEPRVPTDSVRIDAYCSPTIGDRAGNSTPDNTTAQRMSRVTERVQIPLERGIFGALSGSVTPSGWRAASGAPFTGLTRIG
jgi:hypothetical protein